MLLQRSIYANGLPVNIEVFQLVADEPVHYHIDTEILYILKGAVHLKNGYCHYELHEGDIFTNSGHEVHQLTKSEEGTLIARIHISTHFFSQFFPDLSKACYRTYTRNTKGRDRRYERLRELLFQLLLKHSMQSSNYKGECVHLTVDIIKVLDQHFNLFAIEKDMIVGVEKADQIAIRRISHICQYVYQHYAEKITLEDLSNMEHLNAFYLSHLIKEFTGMSFRDLLCLARVEWSEILLLDTDDSISHIAKAVGFSTTTYYEKYFAHWFRHTPAEHREMYSSQMQSDLNPIVQQPVSLEVQTELIRQLYAAHRVRICEDSLMPSITLNINTDLQAAAIAHFSGKFAIVVTEEDYCAMGLALFPLLHSLSPEQVFLQGEQEEITPELRKLARLLRAEGFRTSYRICVPMKPMNLPGLDSILLPVQLLQEVLSADMPLQEFRLRDAENHGQILQGGDGLVTAQGIRKPVFFMLQMLSCVEGDIICRGSQYCILRESGLEGQIALRIFVYTGSEALKHILQSAGEGSAVRSVLNEYIDEVTVDISLRLPAGSYAVEKMEMQREQNIFAHISGMDFREDSVRVLPLCADLFSGSPRVEAYVDDVRTVLNISFSAKGAGFQAAMIQKLS